MKMVKVLAAVAVVLCTVRLGWADIKSTEDEIVVTATRIGQKNYKLASNVTVITSEEIQDSNAATIADILKQSLGVHITDNGTSKSKVVDIRGFGDTASRNTLVLINGRKINSVDISAPDLTQIPLEAVERIEVIRGAGSVLFGDNAVGGVINIITKKGAGPLSGRIGTSYGSYDAQKTDVEVSGSQGEFSYFFYSKYNDERGYRDNSDLLAKDYNTRLGYNFSDKVKLDLDMGWNEDSQELPGGLLDSELATKGRRATVTDSDIVYTKDRYAKFGMDIAPWPENVDWGHAVIEFHYRNRDVYDSFNQFGPFNTKRQINTKGVTGKYVFNQTVLDHEVNFVTGVDAYDTDNDILGTQDNVDDITISKTEVGPYGFLQCELINNVFVNGGVRYQQAHYTFNQRNADVFQEQEPHRWAYMGGVKYEYAPGSNVHFNYQQTFRFLATDEWYSTANFPSFGITPGLKLNLNQQTGIQYEAGIKHNLNDKALITLTPYYMVMSNEIFFDPVTFANSNYDKTRRYGVELGTKVDLSDYWHPGFLDKLEFFSNYTWQAAEFLKGSNNNKEIPGAAQNQVSTGFSAEVFKHYNWSITGNYVGSRFAINDVQNVASPVKPYFTLDTKVAFRHKNLEIYGGINNITNTYYDTYTAKSTSSTVKSHYPAPTRNYVMGMNIKF